MKVFRLAVIGLFVVMIGLLSACEKTDSVPVSDEKAETMNMATLPDTVVDNPENVNESVAGSSADDENPAIEPAKTTVAANTTAVSSTVAPTVTTVHSHAFTGTSCTVGGKCACGAVGNALGHDYTAAGCTTPEVCKRCGAVRGAALGEHSYVKGKCTRCGDTNGPLTPGEAALFNNKLSDEENAQALAVAREIVSQVNAQLPHGSDLDRVSMAAQLVSQEYRKGVHLESGNYYHTAYGVFVKRESSCAGCCRALGLVLSCMGYQWSHVNENQWTHQWLSVTMDGQVGWADGQIGWVGYGEYPFA